jgi:phage-related protein
MISWRNGKGGFVGGLKTAIRGVFQYAHSITSLKPDTPDLLTGVMSVISDSPSGVKSSISASLSGVSSEIEENTGASSTISDGLDGVKSLISSSLSGVESKMP